MMLAARSVLALLVNLRDDELDLPFVACSCWHDDAQVPDSMATVTATEITLHRPA